MAAVKCHTGARARVGVCACVGPAGEGGRGGGGGGLRPGPRGLMMRLLAASGVRGGDGGSTVLSEPSGLI